MTPEEELRFRVIEQRLKHWGEVLSRSKDSADFGDRVFFDMFAEAVVNSEFMAGMTKDEVVCHLSNLLHTAFLDGFITGFDYND